MKAFLVGLLCFFILAKSSSCQDYHPILKSELTKIKKEVVFASLIRENPSEVVFSRILKGDVAIQGKKVDVHLVTKELLRRKPRPTAIPFVILAHEEGKVAAIVDVTSEVKYKTTWIATGWTDESGTIAIKLGDKRMEVRLEQMFGEKGIIKKSDQPGQ